MHIIGVEVKINKQSRYGFNEYSFIERFCVKTCASEYLLFESVDNMFNYKDRACIQFS